MIKSYRMYIKNFEQLKVLKSIKMFVNNEKLSWEDNKLQYQSNSIDEIQFNQLKLKMTQLKQGISQLILKVRNPWIHLHLAQVNKTKEFVLLKEGRRNCND